MPHFNIMCNSVTKATGDSGIKNMSLIAIKSTFSSMPHFNIICNSVTKATGDSGIKNRVSLPSNQHFPQCLISTSYATASQRQQETQELKTESHCHQINIFLNASFQHHVQQRHKGNRRLRKLKTESHCHQINIFLNASFQHHVQQRHKGNRRLRN